MNLRDGEQIIRVIRQHWLWITSSLVPPVVILFVCLTARFYYNYNFFGYGWQVTGAVFLAMTAWIFYKIFIWRKTGLYVTNQRVVSNKQGGIFSRTVTELLYQDVNDITFDQKGVAASVNNYGTLIIKTPSDRKIILRKIANPEGAVELINKIRFMLVSQPKR